MRDELEDIRRIQQANVNAGLIQPEGQEWNTQQLGEDFEVLGFSAPYVVVRRRSDGVMGSLMFRHEPRTYFGFVPDGSSR